MVSSSSSTVIEDKPTKETSSSVSLSEGQGFDHMSNFFVSLAASDSELMYKMKRAFMAYFSKIAGLMLDDDLLRTILKNLNISDVDATFTEVLTNIANNNHITSFRNSFCRKISILQPSMDRKMIHKEFSK